MGRFVYFTYMKNHKNELKVGKYTSPMDPMGMHGLIQGPFLVDWCDHQKSDCIFFKNKNAHPKPPVVKNKNRGPKP